MKRLFCSSVVTIALLAVPLSLSNVYAQGGPTGAITGVVKDEARAVVPGARITAVNPGTSGSFQAVANDLGLYTLRALPVGSYNISAEKEGFKKALQEGVVVQVKNIVHLLFRDDQRVARHQRCDIQEGDEALILRNDLAGDFSIYNSGKDRWHNFGS